ncbi:polysaccharide deacetylase family protein [Flavitalea flava]
MEQLEQHFQFLQSEGYSTILLSDLIACNDQQRPLPEKPVLISFDDGFLDNFEIAYPLAVKYEVKLNFFVVPDFIRRGLYREKPCMRTGEMQKMDPSVVEFGLHSYDHQSYEEMVPSRIGTDLDICKLAMEELGITYQPCLAYPFGAYPRRKGYDQDRLFEILEERNIRLAFRIGNRINRMPLRRQYLIQRLDIRGDESFDAFRVSLAFGRKLFGMNRLFIAVFAWNDRLRSSFSPGARRFLKIATAFILGMIFFLLILRMIQPV